MKDLLFMLADLWMIFAGFYFGWKFIRHYNNYLLGLEWMIVATSGSNFLLWALLGGDEGSFLYSIAYFFDAFSRSVGITLILVMGLMRVTHRYKPTVTVDVGAFALAIVAGLYLQQFRAPTFYVGPATFYVVVNVLTTLFLVYFSWRLWRIGAKGMATLAALVTAAGSVIAITYDFFPIPGDDAHRTLFYAAALATWGCQLFGYFSAYRALHHHNVATGAEPASNKQGVVRG
ncbi:transporter [Saccharopolyspora rosea]|uniref:Transporter n=1 Tax=Saccharopolyspora rosea TaxID=524884 RepID=A0ABW3FNU4_9PSEU|nr:transporter [Saccharopolyspora rosea]